MLKKLLKNFSVYCFLIFALSIQASELVSIEMLLVKAQQGDEKAMYEAGMLYNNVEHEHYDKENAFWYLMAAAKRGYVPAFYEVALMYLDHQSEHFDVSKAHVWANGFVLKGGSSGEGLLAYTLVMLEKDEQRLDLLAHTALKDRQPYALLALSWMYYKGFGVSQSTKMALGYLAKAKKAGFDVQDKISEFSKQYYAPTVFDVNLYGLKREDIKKLFLNNQGQLAIPFYEQLDTYSFPNSLFQIENIAVAFNKQSLASLVSFFFAKEITAEQIDKKLTAKFGRSRNIAELKVWKSEFVQVSRKPSGDCSTTKRQHHCIEQQIVEYKFSPLAKGITFKRVSNESATFNF